MHTPEYDCGYTEGHQLRGETCELKQPLPDVVKPGVITPKPVTIKSQTKMEKVKEWTGDLLHPVAVATKPARFTVKKAYGSFHKRVMEPTNAWADRHSGLINLGGTCGNFGINALLGAKKLGN